MTKPKKKTVTVWLFIVEDKPRPFAEADETERASRSSRRYWTECGFKCGPITRVEVKRG